MFPFLIILKQIHVVRLWTCRNKHFLILLCVFVTNNIASSEHEMSTAKSLRYMAHIAPVSKCQPQKKWLSVPVLHSYYPEWDHALLWLCPFTRILWHFLIHFDVWVQIRYCSTAQNIWRIMFIFSTAIDLRYIAGTIDYGVSMLTEQGFPSPRLYLKQLAD